MTSHVITFELEESQEKREGSKNLSEEITAENLIWGSKQPPISRKHRKFLPRLTQVGPDQYM